MAMTSEEARARGSKKRVRSTSLSKALTDVAKAGMQVTGINIRPGVTELKIGHGGEPAAKPNSFADIEAAYERRLGNG